MYSNIQVNTYFEQIFQIFFIQITAHIALFKARLLSLQETFSCDCYKMRMKYAILCGSAKQICDFMRRNLPSYAWMVSNMRLYASESPNMRNMLLRDKICVNMRHKPLPIPFPKSWFVDICGPHCTPSNLHRYAFYALCRALIMIHQHKYLNIY